MPWPKEARCTLLWGISPLSPLLSWQKGIVSTGRQIQSLRWLPRLRRAGPQRRRQLQLVPAAGAVWAHIDLKKPSPTALPDAQGRRAFSPSLTLNVFPWSLSFPPSLPSVGKCKEISTLRQRNDKLSISPIPVETLFGLTGVPFASQGKERGKRDVDGW